MNSERNSKDPSRRDFIRQASCAAVGSWAIRNTIRDLQLMNAAVAQTGVASDYKALVCIFLAGGNDANNWIVPTDTTTYDQYASIRGNLGIPKSSLLTLRTGGVGSPAYSDVDGHTYGFHPSCPELQTLFGEDKLAVLFNVGTLVRPITRAEYLSGAAGTRPPQLFSHSDQVTHWQTSIPDQPPATGWGGRVADLLDSTANTNGSLSMSVSLNGANTFQIGNLISQYQVSTTGAVVPTGDLMTGTGARIRAMKNILGLSRTSLQRTTYADVVENAIAVGELLNTKIAATLDPTDSPASYAAQNASAPWRWNTGLTGIYSTASQANGLGGFPNTTLGTQLKMVARLIQARGPAAFDMRRQIFFCGVGGYDTHTSQVLVNGVNDPVNAGGAHFRLLDEVSACMFAFQRAMEQLGVSNNVTTFTASDFSRTLPTNSQGSDHGWGSHHLIMGGAVRGGQTYGRLPNFALNGPDDTGLGRWIPKLAVDQYSATLAKWFGVDAGANMSSIFPNLGRFSTADLGFML